MEQILQNNKMLFKYLNITQGTQYCILSLIRSLTRKCSLLVIEDTAQYSGTSNFSAHTYVENVCQICFILFYAKEGGVRSINLLAHRQRHPPFAQV